MFNINYKNLLFPFIKYVYTSSILIHRHHYRTPWRDDQSINISTCGMGDGVRIGVQVFRKKLHTHIHLEHAKVELYLSQKKEKKKKKKYRHH